MIRKILLSAVLAISTVTAFSVPALDVNANPPVHRHGHVHFEVLYRHRLHWDSYGTYHTRFAAEQAAERLRCQGYLVRIEVEIVR